MNYMTAKKKYLTLRIIQIFDPTKGISPKLLWPGDEIETINPYSFLVGKGAFSENLLNQLSSSILSILVEMSQHLLQYILYIFKYIYIYAQPISTFKVWWSSTWIWPKNLPPKLFSGTSRVSLDTAPACKSRATGLRRRPWQSSRRHVVTWDTRYRHNSSGVMPP